MDSIFAQQEQDQIAEAFRILRRKSKDDRYFWINRPGMDFSKVADAQEVGERLEAIAEENGWCLPTQVVVEEGMTEGSVIYPCFEHDQYEAAKKWHTQTARHLVNSIRIVKLYKDAEGVEKEITVNAFHSISVEGKRAYVPIQIIARQPLYQNQVVNKLLDEARNLAVKARQVGLFSKVVAAIDELPDEKLPEWAELVDDKDAIEEIEGEE